MLDATAFYLAADPSIYDPNRGRYLKSGDYQPPMTIRAMLQQDAWRRRPLSTSCRIALSYPLRAVPRLRRRTVTLERYGIRLIVNLALSGGLHIYRYGFTEPELDFLKAVLREGDTVIDVGANQGLYSLVASKAVGPSGRVAAIEPAGFALDMLRRNVTTNAAENVTVLPFAASDREGERRFNEMQGDRFGLSSFSSSSDDPRYATVIPTRSIDRILPSLNTGTVRLIKIDVEGAECSVLRGCMETLRAHRPLLVVELEPDHLFRLGASVDEMRRLLEPLGYRAFRVEQAFAGPLQLVPDPDWNRPIGGPNAVLCTSDALDALGMSVR